MKETKRLNLGLDEDHATYSRECLVYQNNVKKKEELDWIGYLTTNGNSWNIYKNIQGILNNFTQREIIGENTHNGRNQGIGDRIGSVRSIHNDVKYAQNRMSNIVL